MRKILIAIVAIIMLCSMSISAQNITKNYHDEPMSNVLRDIDSVYTAGNLSFIYNELEDFTVTVDIKNKTIIEAIYEIIGFYPIKVNFVEKNIYIECWQKEPNRLKGRLIDENLQPVQYANVHLFNPTDTTFITGGVSNANGDFVIPCDAKEVLLKTHCIGYMPYSRVYEVGSIGTVRIHTDAKLLREVKIEQKQVEYNGDKIIAYPTAMQIKHSYDFFSLLNQQPFPGLFVDELNRSISSFNGTPIILVDGVKRSTKDLYGIQPKNIKKIEYSMNLPMKYANSGASGVIYIYLKDPKAAGGSFYTDLMFSPTTGFVNADVGATYNQGKSQFTLDYEFSLRDYNERIIDRNESYIGDDFRVDFKEEGSSSPFDYNTHDIRAGYNYRHDNTMYFSMKFNNEIFTRHAEEAGYVQDSYSGNYNRVTSNRNYAYTPSLDLYIQKEWKGGNTLEAQVVGSLSNNGYERTYKDEYETGEEKSFPSKVNTDHQSLVSEITYKKTFSQKTQLSAGFQNELSKSENNYVLNDYITTLEENNSYAYVNLSQSVGKMVLNIGTGLKYIKMKSEKNEREFARNLTSLSFAGSPLNKLYISLTGSYYPNIPGLSALTDLEQVSNDYLLVNGNPNLKVGHRFNTRLSLATDVKKKLGIVFVNTFNTAIDPLYNNISYMGNGKFLRRTENYDKWQVYEARLVFTLNEVFNKKFTARVESFYLNYKTEGDNWKHRLNSFGLNVVATGYFGKWMAQMTYRLPYKTLSAEQISKTEPWSSLTLGYRHKNWFFAASGNLLFTKKGTEYPFWNLSDTYSGSGNCYIKDNANMITFLVRYNVNFGKLFGKTKKRTLHNQGTGASVLTL